MRKRVARKVLEKGTMNLTVYRSNTIDSALQTVGSRSAIQIAFKMARKTRGQNVTPFTKAESCKTK